jgi:hemerythrin-like domain-containing protein
MRTPARNVSDFLGGDHRRLEAILSAVEGLVESSAFVEAAARFAEFVGGLSRHIDMEETSSFPPLRRRPAWQPVRRR